MLKFCDTARLAWLILEIISRGGLEQFPEILTALRCSNLSEKFEQILRLAERLRAKALR